MKFIGKLFKGVWNGIKTVGGLIGGAVKSAVRFFTHAPAGKLALVGLLGVGLMFWGGGMARAGGIVPTILGRSAQVVGAGMTAGSTVELGRRAVRGAAEDPNERRAAYEALEEKRAEEEAAAADADRRLAEAALADAEALGDPQPLPTIDQALGADGPMGPTDFEARIDAAEAAPSIAGELGAEAEAGGGQAGADADANKGLSQLVGAGE